MKKLFIKKTIVTSSLLLCSISFAQTTKLPTDNVADGTYVAKTIEQRLAIKPVLQLKQNGSHTTTKTSITHGRVSTVVHKNHDGQVVTFPNGSHRYDYGMSAGEMLIVRHPYITQNPNGYPTRKRETAPVAKPNPAVRVERNGQEVVTVTPNGSRRSAVAPLDQYGHRSDNYDWYHDHTVASKTPTMNASDEKPVVAHLELLNYSLKDPDLAKKMSELGEIVTVEITPDSQIRSTEGYLAFIITYSDNKILSLEYNPETYMMNTETLTQ